MPPLRNEIAELLRMPENGAGAPSLDAIESTLTHGYAEAGAHEADRTRVERRNGELAQLRTLLHDLQVVRRRRRAAARAA